MEMMWLQSSLDLMQVIFLLRCSSDMFVNLPLNSDRVCELAFVLVQDFS